MLSSDKSGGGGRNPANKSSQDGSKEYRSELQVSAARLASSNIKLVPLPWTKVAKMRAPIAGYLRFKTLKESAQLAQYAAGAMRAESRNPAPASRNGRRA